MSPPDLHELAVWLFLSIIAITFHEAAHGWVAYKRGDKTAYMLGRVSFNPARHIDPFGTLILPIMMRLSGLPFTFGWAKPLPVNFRNLKNPRLDSLLVAIAGPGMNVILAIVFLVLLKGHLAFYGSFKAVPALAGEVLIFGVLLNLAFAFFNLLPIPPLDGSRVLSAVLPARYQIYLARIERHGLLIILGGLMVLPWLLSHAGIQFDPLDYLLVKPVIATANGLSNLMGMPDIL